MTINNTIRLIVEVIYDLSCAGENTCDYNTLKNDKRIKNGINTLKKYIKGYYSRDKKEYRHGILIEQNHIIAHGTYTWGDEKYDDQYKLNDQFYSIYNDKGQLDKIKERVQERLYYENQLEQLKSENKHFFESVINSIKFSTIPENKIILAEKYKEIYEKLVFTLINECFICNPFNWDIMNNPEDLDFTIKINIKLSDNKNNFERSKRIKEVCTYNNYLHSFEYNYRSVLDKDFRAKILNKLPTLTELRMLGIGNAQYREND